MCVLVDESLRTLSVASASRDCCSSRRVAAGARPADSRLLAPPSELFDRPLLFIISLREKRSKLAVSPTIFGSMLHHSEMRHGISLKIFPFHINACTLLLVQLANAVITG